jgi:hypothetical protein
MRTTGFRLSLIAGALSGSLLFLNGCDPQTRQTVENGIITASSSLLAALLQAVIALWKEANASTTTAAIVDVATRILA